MAGIQGGHPGLLWFDEMLQRPGPASFDSALNVVYHVVHANAKNAQPLRELRTNPFSAVSLVISDQYSGLTKTGFNSFVKSTNF